VVSELAGGFYRIVSASGGKGLQSVGAKAEMAPLGGADNQLWKIDQLSDGSYRIASKATKLALAATAKLDPGNGTGLQTFTGDDAQRWVIAAP
jgi:hypothetical protein